MPISHHFPFFQSLTELCDDLSSLMGRSTHHPSEKVSFSVLASNSTTSIFLVFLWINLPPNMDSKDITTWVKEVLGSSIWELKLKSWFSERDEMMASAGKICQGWTQGGCLKEKWKCTWGSGLTGQYVQMDWTIGVWGLEKKCVLFLGVAGDEVLLILKDPIAHLVP